MILTRDERDCSLLLPDVQANFHFFGKHSDSSGVWHVRGHVNDHVIDHMMDHVTVVRALLALSEGLANVVD